MVRKGVTAVVAALAWTLFLPAAAAVEPSPADRAALQRWVAAAFDPAAPVRWPFSFTWGGRPFRELVAGGKIAHTTQRLADGSIVRTLAWTDHATGLRVRCDATEYAENPAVEWVVHFHNAGRADSPLLEDIQAMDADFDGAPRTLHFAEGSHERITDFRPQQKPVAAGDVVRLASFGGRPSDGTLPFFNLAGSDGGVALGIGWTGNWAASFAGTDRAVRARAGMQRTRLVLHPGESIRTPAILAVFWTGSDRLRGQNLLRRTLRAHFSPRPGGKPIQRFSAVSPHGVIPFEQISEANLVGMIENIARRKLAVDYFWIDTGWFTCRTNWARYVGNCDPDPVRFPRGLKPVADAAHKAGMKFLVWFEPERVMPDTWLFEHHPEWLLRPSGDMPEEIRYQINDRFHLFDLGRIDALAWMRAKLSGMIREIGIDAYRNDFNMYPSFYWATVDAPNRQGMAEIRYVTGLYALFDGLAADHPSLLLDTCASGGRRIDFEMLRRALVLTRSDYLWDPIGQQCHTYGLAQWIPITGIGAASLDAYSCRSGLGSHFVLAADFRSQDPSVWQAVRRTLDEHRALAPLYSGDFYPLVVAPRGDAGTSGGGASGYTTSKDAWMAWQFHRDDTQQGIVQAFRRQDAVADTVVCRLRQLDPAAKYRVVDADGRREQIIDGHALMDRGLEITLPTKPAAAVLTYKKVGL